MSRPDRAPDAVLASALTRTDDDLDAPYDLDALTRVVAAPRDLLDAVHRSGLLVAHHVDADGTARYSDADVAAIASGLALLDAGLPLDEFLVLARRTDEAIASVADAAVDAFIRFVRDPVIGDPDGDAAAERLVTAYHRMLPAAEHLVAHHLRRRIVEVATARMVPDGDARE